MIFSGLDNIDLVFVGTAIAGIAILGFATLLNNRKSITNRTVFWFGIAAVLWSFFNYAYQQPGGAAQITWLLRLHAFFAVWYAFFIFKLFYVFPQEQISTGRIYRYGLIPAAAVVALLTLTPFVFDRVVLSASTGRIAGASNGFGVYLFGLFVVGSIVAGPVFLFRRWKRGALSPQQKKQVLFVLVGALITFTLHIVYNFILPAFFGDTRFIQYGAVFIFPFIALTSYSIFRYHLLNIEIISTEILAFFLAVATLFEVLGAATISERILRGTIFLFVLLFSLLLIRSVRREIEVRRQLELLDRELEQKNAQLEDLSRFKSQLLSLASHQIRSPLAAIKGFASLITDGLYGAVSDKVKDAVEKMRNSADELIGLVNTLLDLRKVDEGKMDYQFARTDLLKLVSEVYELMRPLAAAKHLVFDFVPPEGGGQIAVNADGAKLKQVVQNLVDNAIKYTPSGSVRLAAAIRGDRAEVSVADSGVGIPESLVPHLFEEFIRDERIKQQILGTGLGLYIARKIAEAHGGRLSASSPGEGKGSTFTLSLPLLRSGA